MSRRLVAIPTDRSAFHRRTKREMQLFERFDSRPIKHRRRDSDKEPTDGATQRPRRPQASETREQATSQTIKKGDQ